MVRLHMRSVAMRNLWDRGSVLLRRGNGRSTLPCHPAHTTRRLALRPRHQHDWPRRANHEAHRHAHIRAPSHYSQRARRSVSRIHRADHAVHRGARANARSLTDRRAHRPTSRIARSLPASTRRRSHSCDRPRASRLGHHNATRRGDPRHAKTRTTSPSRTARSLPASSQSDVRHITHANARQHAGR